MKTQVVFIHGGEPFTDDEAFLADLQIKTIPNPLDETAPVWHQTLRSDLGDSYELFSPQMPNKQNAKYDEWKIWFERHFGYLRDGAVLVGWSLGGIFLMKYLNENEAPFSIRATILLAAPYVDGLLEEANGKSAKHFGTDTSVLSKNRQKFGEVCLFHSKDDFAVPYSHALQYQELFPDAKLVTFSGQNHFLVPELPELIEYIKQLG